MPPLSRSDILFFYPVALTADEIDGFVAHLFDRGVPTVRPDAVPLPFSSENPPPLVRVLFLLTCFFLLNSFTDLGSFRSIVLVKDLETAQKALSTEQFARSKAEQILQQSKDVNATLSLKLDNVETSLAITQNKLDRKSKPLKTVEADLKVKGLLLESAQQALAEREGSANMMIFLVVAHTAALWMTLSVKP
jgi:hypothetical protein